MSIYIGNDLEDRLEALETENASLKKYNEYRQVVDEIALRSDPKNRTSHGRPPRDSDKH